uniref:Uncharacterized protein n=1 Tax=Lactuca sativa TaxID=4236 RepID=A0A9R1W537_LACSA|nr:hypothetical protein LSAT_V11C300111200 [Lactuca sativa]
MLLPQPLLYPYQVKSIKTSVVFGYRRIEETVELSLNKLHNLKGILSHMQFLPELLMELLQSRFLLDNQASWAVGEVEKPTTNKLLLQQKQYVVIG